MRNERQPGVVPARRGRRRVQSPKSTASGGQVRRRTGPTDARPPEPALPALSNAEESNAEGSVPQLPSPFRSPVSGFRALLSPIPLCVLCPGAPGLKAVPFSPLRRSPIFAFLCVLPGSGQAPAGLPRQGATAPAVARCDLCGEACAIPMPKTREKSYAHKGMHMAWMEKVRKRAQKPAKTAPKT